MIFFGNLALIYSGIRNLPISGMRKFGGKRQNSHLEFAENRGFHSFKFAGNRGFYHFKFAGK